MNNEPTFDPDFGPENEHNQRVAELQSLTWCPSRGCYVDEEGCLHFDEHGQPVG